MCLHTHRSKKKEQKVTFARIFFTFLSESHPIPVKERLVDQDGTYPYKNPTASTWRRCVRWLATVAHIAETDGGSVDRSPTTTYMLLPWSKMYAHAYKHHRHFPKLVKCTCSLQSSSRVLPASTADCGTCTLCILGMHTMHPAAPDRLLELCFCLLCDLLLLSYCSLLLSLGVRVFNTYKERRRYSVYIAGLFRTGKCTLCMSSGCTLCMSSGCIVCSPDRWHPAPKFI